MSSAEEYSNSSKIPVEFQSISSICVRSFPFTMSFLIDLMSIFENSKAIAITFSAIMRILLDLETLKP
jgi:hypothetical protein